MSVLHLFPKMPYFHSLSFGGRLLVCSDLVWGLQQQLELQRLGIQESGEREPGELPCLVSLHSVHLEPGEYR